MPFILVAVFFAVIFLAVVAIVARSRHGNVGVCFLSALATILSIVLMSPVLAGQAALTFLLAVPCSLFRFKPRIVTGAAVAAMAASFALAIKLPRPELKERAKLRGEFPLISVSNRLAHEIRAAGRSSATSPAKGLAAEVERRLQRFEDRGHGNIRRFMLSSVHDKTVDDFVMARGFGPVRMHSVRREEVELPDLKSIPLPSKPNSPYDPDVRPSVPLADVQAVKRPLPSQTNLINMHSSGLEDFFEPERFGYVKDRDHVAGFEPHRFTKMPEVKVESQPKHEWRITRLELVSLLKHKTPVAYASDNLPQMDELEDAPTRPLDPFERAALDRLRSEKKTS